jgi:tetratricopeptide (TPR) repeat protein
MRTTIWLFAAVLSLPVCAQEAVSLLGKQLFPPTLAQEARTRLEQNLAQAKAEYDANPRDADKIIWYGRRLAYLSRYREAVDVFSKGIAIHPSEPKLYRHRGHRYITLRLFDKAIADLSQASKLIAGQKDEIEPDGRPNKLNKPLSTLHFNIWYHLALAHYLRGEFPKALAAYQECMKVSRSNDDLLVATSDWLYMTYRRLGKTSEAAAVLTPIKEKMEIIENDSYFKRLLMYKGVLKPEAVLDPSNSDDLAIATQGYGVGNWYFYNGQKDKAIALFEKLVNGKEWAAFGTIAAEADLKRLRK